MMRRKQLILIFLLFAVSAKLPAQALKDRRFFDRFVVGVEWGYSQCVFQNRDYNYISEEGYRVYEQDARFRLHSNAQMFAMLGYRLSENATLSLLGGYMGAGPDNRLLPALLRVSYFPETDDEDGLFAYAQGGTAWHVHATAGRMAWLATLGGGYRVRLSYDARLDFLIGVRYLHDHPSIPNPEGPGNVPERNIRKNNAGYCVLDLSIAVSF